MEHDFAGTYPILIDGEPSGEVQVTHDGLFWLFDAKCAARPDMVRLSVYGGGAEGYLGLLAPENGALRLRKRLSRAAVSAFPLKIEYAAPRGQPLPEPETEAEPEAEAASEQEDSEPSPLEESIPPPNSVQPPLNGINSNFVSNSAPLNAILAHQKDNSPPPEVNSVPSLKTNSPPEANSAFPIEQKSPPNAFFRQYQAASAPQMCNNGKFFERGSPPAQQWRSCPLPCSLFSDIEAKGATGGIRGALSCVGDGCTRLAVPLSEAHAIGRRSVLHFDESAEIDGTTYVVCKIKNGKPV